MFKKSDVNDIYGLTPMQEGMLVHYQLDPTKNSYFEQSVISLEGDIDVPLFLQAFRLLVQKHDILRTVFLYRKVKKPVQAVLKKREASVEYSDVSFMDNGRVENYIEDFLAQDRRRGFDLEKDMLLRLALIRVAPSRWRAVWTNHHLIMDGWCLGLLFADFIAIYQALKTGGQVQSQTGIPFSRYITWLEGRDAEEGLRFWQRELAGYDGRVDFPSKSLHVARQNYQTAEYSFQIDDVHSTALNDIAKSYNVTLSVIFQCILGILLQRFNNTCDAVFGNVVSGRPPEIDGVEEIIGLFVNTIPVRIRVNPEDTFGQLIKTVHRKAGEAKPHEYVPLAEIQALSSLKQDLIRVVFGFQNYPMEQQMLDACREGSSGISIVDIRGFEQIGNDFNCIVSPGQCVDIRINYNSCVYRESMVRCVAQSFQAVAVHVAGQPESRVLSIPVIGADEAAHLARCWNETCREYDLEQPIHSLIARQIHGNPHRVAATGRSLHSGDTRSGGLGQLTYNSLWEQAGVLASYLRNELELQGEEPVAIVMEPCLERIVAMMGILRAGGAFVPVDPELPANRVRFMIRDSAIRVVISQKKFVGLLNRLQWECPSFESYLCLDSENVLQEEEAEANRLMDKGLWEYVGETAVDQITGGGWQSSYTGEPFSKEEMDEYGENVRKKLEPLLHPEMKLLEIGCASGITMYRLAPQVALYYGVDLSQAIIDWNRREAERRGLGNIRLGCMAAHEIAGLDEDDFDVIIINSVIQCFHGHNYVRRVLGMCIAKLKETGRIFIGDVMDQEAKEELLADLRRFQRERPGYRGKTKTDFSNELFLSRGFFEDLPLQYPAISAIQHSEKIFTIENELTRFRFDVILSVDRSLRSGRVPAVVRKRQHDIRFLKRYSESSTDAVVDPGHLAYMIYTSGSTGRPKGVMVEHRSLVNLCLWHEECFAVTPGDRATQYAGFGFDAAVWEVFPYLYAGALLFVIPNELKLDIHMLRRFFERHDITIGFLPTQFCEQFQETENQSLRAILTGGDKLNRFIPRNYILFNNYGPTENTVVTTTFPVDRQRENIPVGTPVSNVSVVIMACDTTEPQPDGVPGEICIGGKGLSRGYANRPELTIEKFVHMPAPDGSLRSVRLYRSGDLGRRLENGHIEFLGRIDRQVKLRGLRIELGEIENRLLRVAGVAEACVAMVEAGDDGDKSIAAYIVPAAGEEIQPALLRDCLIEDLPPYMVPSHFVLLDGLPLTANGKVDRKALPAPDSSSMNRESKLPDSKTEVEVRAIWADVLGKDEHDLGVTENFFEHGGHSLKATALVSRFRQRLHVEFPLKSVFDHPTIRQMAALIDLQAKAVFREILPAEKMEYYPQSSAQKRLFILEQFDTTGTSYNVPDIYRLKGRLDAAMLQEAFHRLVARHESLRTSFALVDDKPVQLIRPEAGLDIQYLDWRDKDQSLDEFLQTFIRPFDLSSAPLLRATLIREGDDDWLLVLDMHHIIGDGTTMGILVEDFIRLYKGEKLPPLKIQYRDYAVWQHQLNRSGAVGRQLEYWRTRFDGDIPRLELPLDFPRPAVFDFSGSTYDWSPGKETSEEFLEMLRIEGTTLYMGGLAVFAAILYRWSGQDDIVVGSGVANRRHADLERVAGMMVNSLPVRLQPTGELSFRQFLEQAKTASLEAFENQDVQFEELVEHLDPVRDPARNPIFDVLFVVQNFQRSRMVMPGVSIEPVIRDTSTSKFDLTLYCLEEVDQIHFVFEYCSSLFSLPTIRRLASHMILALRQVAANPTIPLQDVDLLSERDKQGILHRLNNTGRDYPKECSLPQLFRESLEANPHHLALQFQDLHMTYAELGRRSDLLAARLQAGGAAPGSPVGVTLGYSLEMAVSVLAILSTGGCYVPINIDYPEERQRYQIVDSNIHLLVAQSSIFNPLKLSIIDPFRDGEQSAHAFSHPSIDPGFAAYIIYTSGSTGKPKGVMVSHRNVVRLVKNTNYIEFLPDDRLLQTGALEFDASTFEIWGTLLNGLVLCQAAKETILSPQKLKRVIATRQISMMWMTSPLFNQMVEADIDIFSPLRSLIVGGDVLAATTINQFRRRHRRLQLINGYGPTENTTFSTTFPIEREFAGSIPIGRPIANSTAFIVSPAGGVQPQGVPGELWVGGDGVALGYVNDPELTARKFVEGWTQGGRVYRTGDKARILDEGVIEFMGRFDHQVKIRGFRIELEEIENRLRRLPGVDDALAMVKQDHSGEKYICAYLASSVGLETDFTKEGLATVLPAYMIPSRFVTMDRFPLTVNGKVDRRALPEPEATVADRDIEQPQEESQRLMVSLFASVLGCRAEDVALDDDFFKIGGHSLKATVLVSRIHKELGLHMPLSAVFSTPTARELARFLGNRRVDSISPVQPVELRRYYPLSSAQRRMYILQRMLPGGVVYNMPAVFPLTGEELDLCSIDEVFAALIQRHESLRTSFELVDDEPVQMIWPRVEFRLHTMDLREDERVEDAIDSFVRPFDLTCPPLMRVEVVRQPGKGNYLLLDLHHIIGDGVSLQVLRREFFQLAGGSQLPPLRIQYKDIAAWQQSDEYLLQLQAQRRYWRKSLSGPLPVLKIPVDYPRPALQSFSGASLRFVLGNEERTMLRRLEERMGITLFVGLSACFHLLLWLLGGQEDLITGFPVAGRRYADMQPVVGMFVNSLALRSNPAAQKTIAAFLFEIKRSVISAFDNQDVPFEELVELLEIKRDAARNPIFDVMLSLQNKRGEAADAVMPDPEAGGQVEYRNRASRFDMTWNALETEGRIYFDIEYCTALFNDETVRQFAGYYQAVVRTVCGDHGLRLADLRNMAERNDWNILEPEDDNRCQVLDRDSSLCERNSNQSSLPGPLSGELERKLAEIWAAVLDLEIEDLSATDDFFSLGGHSLKAVKLTNAVYKAFGVEVGIQEIFQQPTIAGQVAIIVASQKKNFQEIPVLEPRDYYPLSFSQKRIWVLQQMTPESTVFNMPLLLNLPEGDIDATLVRLTLQELALRHDALRTYFAEKEDDVVQVIVQHVAIPLEEIDVANLSSEERQQAAGRLVMRESRTPFRLHEPPLFRAVLIHMGSGKSALLINMHHIVSDGWSMQVMQQDIYQIYRRLEAGDGEVPAPLRIQYKDFAVWQNRILDDSRTVKPALDFWRRYLDGELPLLDLPYDFPESRRETTLSAGYRVVLEGKTRTALEEIARSKKASLFMVLLAGFQMTLSFTRGGDDIMLGIPGAARQHDDLKRIIGLFVNTLIVRGQVDGNVRFSEFLSVLRDNVFGVLEYQSVPLELIFRELGLQYPRLTVFFNMVNIGATELLSLGETIDPFHQERVQDAKFPLTLYLANCKEGIDITCHYFKELFLPGTIQSILELYLHVLRGIAENTENNLKDYRRHPKKRLAKKTSHRE